MRSRRCVATVAVFFLALWFAPAAWAELKLPAVISDNMVLQREATAPVWGWTEPGEMVAVTFANQSQTTKADDDGRWNVVLKELKVGDPQEMTITAGSGESVTLKNILVGEVWICSGQSNMEMSVKSSKDSGKEIAAAEYPEIRLFKVKREKAAKPKTDCQGSWVQCSPASVGDFSGVGYFFARDLHKEIGVPIGIIQAAWGGTPAEFWTSREVLEADPVLKSLVTRGSVLYNGMIAPLIPYAIRGAVWYQGEANSSRAFQYRALLPAMIKNWRTDWARGDFPFGIVQLAPYRYGRNDPACCAELWEAQLLTVKNTPNTGLAVTTDLGNLRDIHPKNKQDVGNRLALWALGTVYGKEDLVYSGPIYKSMKVEGDTIRLSFDHVGGGLASRDGKPPSDFTIAGADEKFHPASATIEGDTVVVNSDEVAEPVAVRFGWRDTAGPNLINKEGLPASPFRTDTFRGVTEPEK